MTNDSSVVWGRPAQVRSERLGITATVQVGRYINGTPEVVVVLRYDDYGPGWPGEEIPILFDGEFARSLGRVLVTSGREACASGFPQAVENGWG
jgi:hypothetical protein